VSGFEIVRLCPEYREWADGLVRERWGETRIVTRGRIHDTSALPGFVALMAAEAVVDEARSRGCKRLWLITTNDNQKAVRFYRNRGFQLAAIHKNALDETRKLKPGLPETGIDGIPLKDEIELELLL